jgi:hypothetical protein
MTGGETSQTADRGDLAGRLITRTLGDRNPARRPVSGVSHRGSPGRGGDRSLPVVLAGIRGLRKSGFFGTHGIKIAPNFPYRRLSCCGAAKGLRRCWHPGTAVQLACRRQRHVTGVAAMTIVRQAVAPLLLVLACAACGAGKDPLANSSVASASSAPAIQQSAESGTSAGRHADSDSQDQHLRARADHIAARRPGGVSPLSAGGLCRCHWCVDPRQARDRAAAPAAHRN